VAEALAQTHVHVLDDGRVAAREADRRRHVERRREPLARVEQRDRRAADAERIVAAGRQADLRPELAEDVEVLGEEQRERRPAELLAVLELAAVLRADRLA